MPAANTVNHLKAPFSAPVGPFPSSCYGCPCSWYPNGNLKFEVDYRNDYPDGPSLTYLKDGTPDAAIKILLTEEAAQTRTERADSTKQFQNALAASRRQLVERHVQDSVRQVNEQTTTAKWAEIQNLKTAEIMLATAYSKQQTLVQAGAQAKLCINL